MTALAHYVVPENCLTPPVESGEKEVTGRRANVPGRGRNLARRSDVTKPKRPRRWQPGDPLPPADALKYHDPAGYVRLVWTVDGVQHQALEHRVIARAEPDQDVHHKNGIKDDNRPENLQLLSRSEHTRLHRSQVTHCRRGHAFTDENTFWRKDGKRSCRICMRADYERAYVKKKAKRQAESAARRLVQDIEGILNTSMEDRLKIASIKELIRGARDDEGMLHDSRR